MPMYAGRPLTFLWSKQCAGLLGALFAVVITLPACGDASNGYGHLVAAGR